jgi:alanine-glyoxylate transaminase/serine-glyoxylate transaminase/serine-pyruvate transaminase
MNASVQKPRGRLFFANPGPTNIPDSVLHAAAHVSVDWYPAEFMELYHECMAGLKRVMKTQNDLVFHTGSGHAAWEAALVNLFSPGDLLLYPQTGNFSDRWGQMARDWGLRTQVLECDWRRGVDMAQVRSVLAADKAREIKAVCVTHNETSTGMVLNPADFRAALDATGHPALLLVDTISSLACMDFRNDEWRVDCAVGGSQKGLMLPTGLSFNTISEKAWAASKQSTLPKSYFSWANMMKLPHKSFMGTPPTSLFYAMKESLRLLLDDEGLDNVFARHARLAGAVRCAVNHWSGNGGPQLYCTNPARYSDSVTTILMPEGYDANKVRSTALERFNVSLGGGLARLAGKAFRIGHLGDLNEPMILGALSVVELSLKINGVPYTPGGVEAAIDYLAGN